MSRLHTLLAAVAVLTTTAICTDAQAQVSASSYSTGGTAISTAHGRGNTRLNSSAVATGGGYARSNITGQGINGGFASGNSRAVSHGGVAISDANSTANGWGARSRSNSYARTVGGFARSDSNAIARGNWADASADATTRTWGTYGSSSSEAIDNRVPSYGNQPVYPAVQPTYYSNGAGTTYNNAPKSSGFSRRVFRRGW
ncbi:hypothetical protein [Roseiconus nitratireducens]|uniref:hypothetical protein n=1 Tax=Roseiconus nitratireducens TaxID=2605748 RepID=UPI001F1CA4F4|nr:hypothetical protein [Roseiconus nitratireducens]